MRISNSGKDKYLECPRKYEIHYIEGYRGKILGSPLFAGSAFDDATGRILLEKKKILTEEEKELMKLTEMEVFDRAFYEKEHNGKNISLPTYQYCKYYSKDYDPDLLLEEDLDNIYEVAARREISVNSFENIEEFIAECKSLIKNKTALGKEEQEVYNYVHWCCMRRKCHLLLKCYREDVMPLIEEVFSIQKEVKLEADGDVLIGYIDFEASFHEEPGVRYICDNKLASKASGYKVEESEQLATYCEYEETNKGCYVVVEKGLRKRDPRHRIHIIKGEIPEEQFEKTFDTYADVVYDIKEGNFPPTGRENKCFSFGSICEFYDYCHNFDDTNLYKKDRNEK